MTSTDAFQQADELTMLGAYLDAQRALLVDQLRGLTPEQATRRLPPSELTLVGLVKHLALVEDHWFQELFLGRPMPQPWRSAPFDDDPDWEFHSAVDDPPEEVLALYAAACRRSRAAVAETADPAALSATVRPRTGQHFSLRWVLLHLIEETAQHNGHADLIRESIDGTTPPR